MYDTCAVFHCKPCEYILYNSTCYLLFFNYFLIHTCLTWTDILLLSHVASIHDLGSFINWSLAGYVYVTLISNILR